MYKTVLIIGANSDVAKALSFELANQFHPSCFLLASQNQTALEEHAFHLRNHATHPEVNCFTLDVTNSNASMHFYQQLPQLPDLVIYAAGYLGDEFVAQTDTKEALKILNVNYTGAMIFLDKIAEDFAKRQSGTIVGITSVAGLIGKKSNYHYGAAKAAFITYLNGLRARLQSDGVHVMTVIPGYIRTKMTAHLKLPKFGLVTASPRKMATGICAALEKGHRVLYLPRAWRLVMSLLPSKILENL